MCAVGRRLVFAALLLLVALLAFLAGAARCPAPARAGFGVGPDNLGLYDSPFVYPRYPGRRAVAWDVDARCAAYCSQAAPATAAEPAQPCAVVCR